jgi:hypothetical protein
MLVDCMLVGPTNHLSCFLVYYLSLVGHCIESWNIQAWQPVVCRMGFAGWAPSTGVGPVQQPWDLNENGWAKVNCKALSNAGKKE